jgi:putative ABC transport system ATP-binding protein
MTGGPAVTPDATRPAAGVGCAVEVDSITRSFGRGAAAVHALRGVSFTVPQGELLAVRGRSGSGKTTLLNLIAGLERPTSGRIWVSGQEVTAMSREETLALRRDRVALVFQSFALLPMLSAAENVGLPMRLSKVRAADRERRARDLLRLVGGRPSYPAGSSSASPLPGRWPAMPGCCWRTNRRGSSTPGPRLRS